MSHSTYITPTNNGLFIVTNFFMGLGFDNYPTQTIIGYMTKTELTERIVYCWVCSKKEGDEAFKKCGGCNVARYCSVICQKADWKGDHKALCKSGKLGLIDIANEVMKLTILQKTSPLMSSLEELCAGTASLDNLIRQVDIINAQVEIGALTKRQATPQLLAIQKKIKEHEKAEKKNLANGEKLISRLDSIIVKVEKTIKAKKCIIAG